MTFNDSFEVWMMAWSKFYNGTSMTSVRSFVMTLAVALVVSFFSVISAIMLLDNTSATAALNKDPGIRAAAQTTETSHHSYGMQIVTAIFSLLGGVIIVNAGSHAVERSTAKENQEAKEKGKMTGLVAAAELSALVTDVKTNPVVTRDHQAVT